MPSSEEISLTKMSLMRGLLENPDFFDEFYDSFFESSPVIHELFKNTDFGKQKDLLREGIEIMILYADGTESGKERLKKIAVIHKKMKLTPGLYDFWRDTLIDTLAKNDPEFSEEHRTAWVAVLNNGIDFFIEFA